MGELGDFVGVEEFARMYGCTVRHAQKLCRQGKAPRHLKAGKTIRFRMEDIEEWMRARTVNPENR